jgi:hypothetical protein
MTINNISLGVTSTVSSASPIVLTAASAHFQIITGTIAQTVTLPNATTLQIGQIFYFNNSSNQLVTINNNGGVNQYNALAGSICELILLTNSTANGTWDIHSFLPSGAQFGTAGLSYSGNLSLTGAGSNIIQVVGGGNLQINAFTSGGTINLSTNNITNGGTITATTFSGALSGNATTATTATNIAGGLGGSIPYQTAVNATSLLANGSAGQVLTSNGTTLAPSWGTPVGMVKLGTSSIAITGSASNQNLSFVGIFTTAYRNYTIILRPTTQVSFTAYPSYALQAFVGTAVPTIASLYGFEMASTNTAVVTPVYTSGATISSAPLIFAVSAVTNREIQFDVLNVGYAVAQAQQVSLMCKSVYNNPGVTGASDRTISCTALSGCTITGLVIQQTSLGVGNNFTLEASIYGYT